MGDVVAVEPSWTMGVSAQGERTGPDGRGWADAGATLLHPSHETAATITASEGRRSRRTIEYTLCWLLVLLGLPGLYAAQRDPRSGGWDWRAS